MTQKIVKSILAKIEVPNLVELLVDRISFAELQSLLLNIFNIKTAKRSPKDIFTDYQSNRFTKPSDIHPILHRKLELKIFSKLPGDVEIIDLSPLPPLGTTSILTTVNQNNVVSTVRNVEVAADTTNLLALECAKQRQELLQKKETKNNSVKLCSSQCIARGQAFENKNFSACFNVIALCTAGRDEGNDQFEMAQLAEHILFYLNLLDMIIDPVEIKKIKLKFFSYEGAQNSLLIENIKTLIQGRKYLFVTTEENSLFGKSYYSRLRFMIGVVNKHGQEFDYVDGGFTDWTARLLSNRKERLLTSGIGIDFLMRTVKLKETLID